MQHGNRAQDRHRGFAFGRLTGPRARKAVVGVVGFAVAGVMLAACSSGSSNASGSSGGSGSQGATTTPSGPPVSISISNAGATVMNPATPVVVKATNGTLKNVAMTNSKTGVVVTGDYSADKTSWTSNVDLGFGSTYSVDATGANQQGSAGEQKATMTTINPSLKSYTNMIPAPGSVPSIGVGMPIIFEFSHPVTNKKAAEAGIKIATTPSQPMGFFWVSSTELDARPQNYWTPGTKIHVMAKLYGTDLGGGNFDQEDRDETYTVHDAWIAKADGNSEQMQIFDNNALVKTMAISMGKGSTPTSNGTHVISAKNQSVQMNSCTYGVCPPDPRAYNETEYWAERITNGGEFVHENPDTVGVQGHANVSHGCINLNEADATWFFNNLGIGDVVEVTNSGGPTIAPTAFIGDWTVPFSQLTPVASA
jgi:lipoprotein-anchoring transpeptidase ErfK/SrfK